MGVKMIKRALLVLFGLVLVVNIAQAREIANVKLQEKINLQNGKVLVLNGAGIRYKFIFKIYVAALYLPAAKHTARAVLDEPGPKRMLMHFVYHKVSQEQMQDGWKDGFSDNLDAKTYRALEPRLKQFNSLFGDLRSGDRVWLDYEPGVGTEVRINGQKKGVISGEDFMRALFSVWLGPEPPSDDLKSELLGLGEKE
jgi:hypothetical protein